MGHAFVDNVTYAGDPDHVAAPLAGLASPAFARLRASGIARDAASPRPLATADPWPFEDGEAREAPPPSTGGARGTTQVVAADADGNLVALITTIGDDFGSKVAVPGTGVLLNNSMMNYDPRPGRANSIAPGKMPFFAVPAIVAAREGRGVFAAAGSGGYPILARRREHDGQPRRLRHGHPAGDRRAPGALAGRRDVRRLPRPGGDPRPSWRRWATRSSSRTSRPASCRSAA